MRYKVKCLTVVVTVTLWLGNLWGCAAPGQEQNYKVTRPDSEPINGKSGASGTDSGDAAPAPGELAAQDAPKPAAAEVPGDAATPADAPKPAPADAPKPAPADAPAITVVYAGPDAETLPSLKGLDRSHWPKIATSAAVGQSRHTPLYFKDCPIERQDPVVRFSDPAETRMDAALANADDRSWDEHSATVFLADVPKFFLDAGLLPFRMIGSPPNEWQTAP